MPGFHFLLAVLALSSAPPPPAVGEPGQDVVGRAPAASHQAGGGRGQGSPRTGQQGGSLEKLEGPAPLESASPLPGNTGSVGNKQTISEAGSEVPPSSKSTAKNDLVRPPPLLPAPHFRKSPFQHEGRLSELRPRDPPSPSVLLACIALVVLISFLIVRFYLPPLPPSYADAFFGSPQSRASHTTFVSSSFTDHVENLERHFRGLHEPGTDYVRMEQATREPPELQGGGGEASFSNTSSGFHGGAQGGGEEGWEGVGGLVTAKRRLLAAQVSIT